MKLRMYSSILLLVAFIGLSATELNAQALKVTGNVIHIAPNELPNTTTYSHIVHSLAFNKGGNSTENRGFWGLGTLYNGFHIGIQYPTPNYAGVGIYLSNANRDVCIGGWDPQSKLDVRGWIRMNGQLVAYSDQRYKKDVKPITTNLNQLSKLNSVEYKASSAVLEQKKADFIKQFDAKDTADNIEYHEFLGTLENQIRDAKKDTTTHFGFIAQELREIYPNLVFEDSEGYLGVNYIGMIPVLVDAIKELKSEINELRVGKGFEKSGTVITSEAKLYQNNPNPFTSNTEIKYYLPNETKDASIRIYNLVGEEIAKFDLLDRGYANLTINGSVLKAGMYNYALLVDGQLVDTKQMVLTK